MLWHILKILSDTVIC